MSSIIKVNTFQDANGNALFSSDGSGNLTGTNKLGITVADLWRQNTDTAISAATETLLTSNWEQADTDGAGTIGSSLSNSSGIFSFPETGLYNITYSVQLHSPSQGATYAGGAIFTTTDNSSYDRATAAYNSIYHSNGFGFCTMFFNFDVTNISTHKVQFKVQMEFAGDVKGYTGHNGTCFTAIRLGA